MVNKLHKTLSEYAEFDISIFFKEDLLVRIFGGAIRDSIVDREIHDIDILVSSKAKVHCENILHENGYEQQTILGSKDWERTYSHLSLINEPHTWMRGKKIIQLISPASSGPRYDDIKRDHLVVLTNVDIICCGVSFDGKQIYENYEGAIEDCLCNKLTVNEDAIMYDFKRTNNRIQKLINRGWDNNIDRYKKLNQILDTTKNTNVIPEYFKTNSKTNSKRSYIKEKQDIWTT